MPLTPWDVEADRSLEFNKRNSFKNQNVVVVIIIINNNNNNFEPNIGAYDFNPSTAREVGRRQVALCI